MFLYLTFSTLNPIVGIVVTVSPRFSLYNIYTSNQIISCIIIFSQQNLTVVFPAASSPRRIILFSLVPERESNIFVMNKPIFVVESLSAYLVLVLKVWLVNLKPEDISFVWSLVSG